MCLQQHLATMNRLRRVISPQGLAEFAILLHTIHVQMLWRIWMHWPVISKAALILAGVCVAQQHLPSCMVHYLLCRKGNLTVQNPSG